MALNFRRLVNGLQLVPKTTSTASLAGELDFDTTSNKLNLNNGTITDKVVTEADVATLTNKTIAAGSNTITGLTNTNLSGSAAISNVNLAVMPTLTIKGNNTGGNATPIDLTISQVNTMLGNSGAATSIGALDAQPENSNGLALVSGVLSTQSADGTHPGVVNNTTQTFSGQKTFSTGITGTLTGNATNVSGTVAIANGGTGQTSASSAFNALNPMTTTGDLIYESASNVASRLPIGTSGQILTVSGGVPTWQTGSGSTNPINLTQISTPANPASGSNDLYFKAVTSSQSIALYTTITANVGAIGATTDRAGQSFTPTSTGALTGITIQIKVGSLSAVTGNLVIGVYSDSAGNPGTLLETSSTLDSSTLTTSLVPYTFNFAGTTSLTASTKYHFVLNPVSLTSISTTITLAYDSPSSTYPGGNYETSSNSGSTWTQDTTSDLYFIVTGSVADPTNGRLYSLSSSGIEIQIGSGGTIGAWTTYTPTTAGFGTLSNATFAYRTVGSSGIEILGTFQSGTVGAGTASVSLPSTYSVSSIFSASQALLIGKANNATSGSNGLTVFVRGTDTFLSFGVDGNAPGALVAAGGTALVGNNVIFSFFCNVPL